MSRQRNQPIITRLLGLEKEMIIYRN